MSKNFILKLGADRKQGFTLIELLVVLAVIALLASVVLVAVNQARIKARDGQRKQNLRQIQKAVELYYNDHGAYPSTTGAYYMEETDGCPPLTGCSNVYVPGLVPNYMANLPHDPNAGKTGNGWCTDWTISGYGYYSNGVDYKIRDYCLAEETVTSNDFFYDPRYDGVGYNPNTYSLYTPGATNW